MNPIIFNEMGESDAGWKTVYNKDSSEGVQRNDVLPEKEHEGIKLRPRVVTKPNQKPILENQLPGNIGRPESQMTEYTVRNRPERSPVLFQPSSPSTKEFYYAPNDLAGKRVRGFQTSGDQLNLPHDWPEESSTNYGDSDLNLTVGPDGYAQVEQDSNFSRKPGTWRFRTKDNDKSLQTRDESLPDLRDVGVSEMIYPLQSGLRPIVFGATPRQRAQRKKLNRKKKRQPKDEPKEAPKVEQKVAEELAKKVEAPKPAEAKPEPPKAQPSNNSFSVATEGEDEKTVSGVAVVTDSAGKEVLRYGLKDGKGVMTPTYDEAKDGPQWLEAMKTVLRHLGDILPEWVATNENLPEPPSEATDSLGEAVKWGRAQKKGYSSGYRGNILEDPALADLEPKMLDQEKLFTSIRKWEGDSYVTTADRLDVGTKEVLAEKPQGEGHYFSWNYVTPEQSEKKAAEDVEKEGFTISPGEGVLSVQRLGGWSNVETEVMKKRRARPA
jgi:hypothetical protein